MNVLANRIVFGAGYVDGLRFVRVMAGEYTATAPNGWVYEIYRKCDACTGCDHEHWCWLVVMIPAYGVRVEVTRCRTLTDAKVAATQHAADEGVLPAVGSAP